MIIVAGWLEIEPSERDRYVAGVAHVARAARGFPGCHEFVQAPDPVAPGRVLVYERWESAEELEAFRSAEVPEPSETAGEELPEVLGAEVARYLISAISEP